MRKKLRNSKRNSSLIEKTIESYPFLKEIYKPLRFNMFKTDSADFSAESFFDLVLDFLVMYKVLLYSVTVCLKSGLLKNSNKQFSTYCFLNFPFQFQIKTFRFSVGRFQLSHFCFSSFCW